MDYARDQVQCAGSNMEIHAERYGVKIVLSGEPNAVVDTFRRIERADSWNTALAFALAVLSAVLVVGVVGIGVALER